MDKETLELLTPQAMAARAAELQKLYGPEDGLTEYREWIGKLRQECFERRAKTMDPEGALTVWVEKMTMLHGPRVRLHSIAYSWLAALGVARYGEACAFWPAQFSEHDVIRAKRWLYRSKMPEGATYITKES